MSVIQSLGLDSGEILNDLMGLGRHLLIFEYLFSIYAELLKILSMIVFYL